MHLVIVEDLELDREKLASLLREDFARRGEHVDLSLYESGEDFLAQYRPRACDGLFLDVLLGGMDGIEVARRVREEEGKLPIVFTTRERDYAVDGFDIGARDYLVKPLTGEKVSRCVDRILEYLARPSSIPLQETSSWGHAAPLDIPLDEIVYAEYCNHIVDVHTTQGVFCTRQSFQEFTARLPQTGRFYVCGRGLVVNLSQVTRVLEHDLLLKNGDRISFSRNRRREIQKAYADWSADRARKGGWAK